jgi:hypothetical protein
MVSVTAAPDVPTAVPVRFAGIGLRMDAVFPMDAFSVTVAAPDV